MFCLCHCYTLSSLFLISPLYIPHFPCILYICHWTFFLWEKYWTKEMQTVVSYTFLSTYVSTSTYLYIPKCAHMCRYINGYPSKSIMLTHVWISLICALWGGLSKAHVIMELPLVYYLRSHYLVFYCSVVFKWLVLLECTSYFGRRGLGMYFWGGGNAGRAYRD